MTICTRVATPPTPTKRMSCPSMSGLGLFENCGERQAKWHAHMAEQMTLEAEDTGKHSIYPRGRQAVVGHLASRQFFDGTRGHCQRKEERVEIAAMADFQPGFLGCFGKTCACVAPEMVVTLVMCRPQQREGRNGHDYLAALTKAFRQGGKGRLVSLDMFEHVEQANKIISLVAEGHVFGQSAKTDIEPRLTFCRMPCAIVEFERVDLAEVAQHRKVAAAAATGFEDRGIGFARQYRLKKRGDDRPACGEPPMPGFEFVHAVINTAFHLRPPFRSRGVTSG